MINKDLKNCKVCVLRGGPSYEYELSLDSGSYVLMSLEDRKNVYDVLIDKKGGWFRDGKSIRPEQAFFDIDVVFNALHGAYGEDGRIQKILEAYSVPYTGSDSFSSAIAMNKHTAKKFFRTNGIKTPFSKLIKKDDSIKNIAMNIFNSMPLPVIIKPVAMGSSLGITTAFNFCDLEDVLEYAFSVSDELIAEEYIVGKVISCGVIESFRGEDLYALVPVYIKIPEGSVFLEYEKRHALEYEVPAQINKEDKIKIQEAALLAHTVLGLRHYSQSDFILSKKGLFLLETNSLPHLGQKSPFIEALRAVGSDTKEFVEHVIELTLK